MNDEIMSKYMDLSLTQVIPNLRDYAAEWSRLALEADADGRPSTAAACRARAEHYRELAVGEYIRLINGSFAELLPVDAP